MKVNAYFLELVRRLQVQGINASPDGKQPEIPLPHEKSCKCTECSE